MPGNAHLSFFFWFLGFLTQSWGSKSRKAGVFVRGLKRSEWPGWKKPRIRTQFNGWCYRKCEQQEQETKLHLNPAALHNCAKELAASICSCWTTLTLVSIIHSSGPWRMNEGSSFMKHTASTGLLLYLPKPKEENRTRWLGGHSPIVTFTLWSLK